MLFMGNKAIRQGWMEFLRATLPERPHALGKYKDSSLLKAFSLSGPRFSRTDLPARGCRECPSPLLPLLWANDQIMSKSP